MKTKRRASKGKRTSSLQKSFESLRPFTNKQSTASLSKNRMFPMCVRSSLSKCYEFNLEVPYFTKRKSSFFLMASLRGLCEDLIVLNFIKKIPTADREELVLALQNHETAKRIRQQGLFFSSFRPQQSVLRLRDVDSAIASHEGAARAVWNRNGWPKLKKGAMPPIRQLAEKQGLEQLSVLYDYLYRLTSAGVHFSVASLFRAGWGESPKRFVFSTRNFSQYFSQYCSIYGAFLFCLYFEFFASILRPGAKERADVAKIREQILFEPRWPEMVTFEEMNQKPPEGGETFRMLVSAFQAVSRKRLIAKGINYSNRNSAERKRVADLLKALSRGMEPHT